MTSPHEPLTAALLAALVTTGLPVGDHEAPVPTPTDRPYTILYAIAGGGTWGPGFHDHTQNAVAVYQLTAVGQRRDQVEMLADRNRTALLGRTPAGTYATGITPTGLQVIDRDLDAVGGVDKNDEVWTFAERFRFTVTPA